ncbi:MAG: hypothetical protein IT563_09800 [Alphaproteobacteria bacterium]|nr:hypothetical protein [Alphaproteobacteria bacterium]
MGAIYSSNSNAKPVFRNQDELVDWIVQRLEQPQVLPEAANVAVPKEPEPRNDWERIDWIMRRLNKPEDTPAVSPWSDNPDNFDALEQPSRIDAQAMAPIYEQVGFTPNGDPRNMANWQTQAVASMPRDPAAKIRVFARNRFPDLSPDDALGRYGVMGDRIFYIDRDGSAKWEEPSALDVIRTPDRYAASWAGPSLPIAGGFVGGLAGGAIGSAGGVGGSYYAGSYGAGAGAAAGEWLRQEFARRYAAERMNDRDRWVDTALAGWSGFGGYSMSRPIVHSLYQRYSHLVPAAVGAGAQIPARWIVSGSAGLATKEGMDQLRDLDDVRQGRPLSTYP